MPYMFQKGEDWQLLEWWLCHDADHKRTKRKLDMLQVLAKAGPEKDSGTLKLISSTHQNPMPGNDDPANEPAREKILVKDQDHLNKDWFGLNAQGKPPPKGSPLGWWVNWRGNARSIVATTLAKAILVSLGLPSDSPLPTTKAAKKDLETASTRDWPLEFQWICPVGWFQAGIAWRQTDPHAHPKQHPPGLVTVTWLTPGTTAPGGLFMDLLTPARKETAGKWWGKLGTEPLETEGLRGSWIVGQRFTEDGPNKGLNKGGSGEWVDVIPSVISKGDVVTIRPAWLDGGVNPGPPPESDKWKY